MNLETSRKVSAFVSAKYSRSRKNKSSCAPECRPCASRKPVGGLRIISEGARLKKIYHRATKVAQVRIKTCQFQVNLGPRQDRTREVESSSLVGHSPPVTPALAWSLPSALQTVVENEDKLVTFGSVLNVYNEIL